MIPVILSLCAVLFAAIRITLSKEHTTFKRKLATVIKSFIFFNVGVQGLLAFYAHIFMPDFTAQQIGWEIGSPFQSEIGFANLAFGVLGILTPWTLSPFWLATVIGYSILLFGAAGVHIQQMRLGDYAPYNSGIFLWGGDIIIPLIILGLMSLYFFRYMR